MSSVRGKRFRAWTAALVQIALTLQMFAVALSSAAMASGAARTALVNAELAPLGITLAELPCHSGVDAAVLPSDEGKIPHHAKKDCPACSVHAGGAAILPDLMTVAPFLDAGMSAPRFESVVLALRAATLGQARAPPAAAA